MVSDINIKGTNHKIGGSQADGQWVQKRVTVFSGQNWSATGTQTYTISNYLPDNIYTYEILVSCYATTGATSGNACSWWARDMNNQFDGVMGYCRTRTASNVASGNSCILPVKQVNGVLTFNINVTNTGALGGQGLYVTAYRRLGGTGTPPTYYTLTINPTPADATVTFNKGTVVGKTCTVTAGTSVTYTVSKSGYTTKSATVTVNSSQTVNVTLPQITAITMYGYDWAGTNTYLIGTNNTSGFIVDGISGAITGKSGNVGVQGSTLTISGTTYTYNPSAYPFVSTITANGVVLYLYYNSNGALLGVKSDVATGKKGIIASILTGFIHPSSVTSTKMTWNNGIGTSTATRKSSIDTTFTGS